MSRFPPTPAPLHSPVPVTGAHRPHWHLPARLVSSVIVMLAMAMASGGALAQQMAVPFASAPEGASGGIWLNLDQIAKLPPLGPICRQIAPRRHVGTAVVERVQTALIGLKVFDPPNPSSVEIVYQSDPLGGPTAMSVLVGARFNSATLHQQLTAAGFAPSGSGVWKNPRWTFVLLPDGRLLFANDADFGGRVYGALHGTAAQRAAADLSGAWINRAWPNAVALAYIAVSPQQAHGFGLTMKSVLSALGEIPGADATANAQDQLRLAGLAFAGTNEQLYYGVDLMYEDTASAFLTTSALQSALSIVKLSLGSQAADDPDAQVTVALLDRFRIGATEWSEQGVNVVAYSETMELAEFAPLFPLYLEQFTASLRNRATAGTFGGVQSSAALNPAEATRKIQLDLKRIDDANQEYAFMYNLDASGTYPSFDDLVALGYLREMPMPPGGGYYVQARRVMAPTSPRGADGYPSWPGGTPQNGRVHPDLLP